MNDKTEKLKDLIMEVFDMRPSTSEKCIATLDDIKSIIENEEKKRTEVVRCKECKHRPTMPEDGREVQDLVFPDDVCPLQCGDNWYNQEPADDWFCANGERSEEWK